jgi:histidine triad (HIT) family protein
VAANEVPSTCAFCEIRDGRLEASLVHRDETQMAFLDINPATRGHLLVVPTVHAASVLQLPNAVSAGMFALAVELAAQTMRSELQPEGFNLFLADGEVAFQEVFHVHLHVLPRYPDDGFEINAKGWAHPHPARTELNRLAAAIRAAAEDPGELKRRALT